MGVHDGRAAGAFIVFCRHDVLMLHAHHVGDILADAQYAEPSLGVDVFQLCRLQLPLLLSGRIRHILEENIGLLHRQGDLVVLHEMLCRLGIKDLGIGQPDHPVRALFVRIIGKGLVAGKINAAFGVLGKGHAGHVVQKRRNGVLQLGDSAGRLRLVLRLRQAFAQLLRIPVVVQHHRHDEQEQPQRYHGVEGVGAADLLRLFLEILGSLLPDLRDRVIGRMALVVFQNVCHGLIRRALCCPRDPHHRCEQHQHQQDDPHDHALAVLTVLIPPDQNAEICQSQQRPYHEQHIRLRLHRVEGQQTGDEQQHDKHGHQEKADKAGQRLQTALFFPGMAENRMRNQAVDDRCAQRRDVDDPADRRPSEEGNEHRNRNHGPDGPVRSAVGVHALKGTGHLALPSRRIQQAAQGHEVSDQAGQDYAEQGQHQHRDAETAEIVIRRVKGRHRFDALEVSHITDIRQPAVVLRRIG